MGVIQRMSKAGCPYDNVPMDRYFNTLKIELIFHRYYHTDDEIINAVEYFAYIWNNHVCPQSFNNGLTLYEARNNTKTFRSKCLN